MSTVNVNRVVDASGGVLAPISSVMRNRIINGAMVIDQRGSAGTPVSNAAGTNTYFVDRWHLFGAVAARMNGRQSTVAPVGFTNSSLVTSLAATTAGAGDAYGVRQIIEGFNIADLGWGTANAKTVTLSFWVRASITGTYSFACWNQSNTPSYVANYTIVAANTWEYKTITISGETASAGWNTTNGIGLNCWWDLGSGSNFNTTAGSWNSGLLTRTAGSQSIVGTNGATFYITGVQLEVGTQATSFEYRQYTTELALCQRYFISYGGTNVYERMATCINNATNNTIPMFTFPVEMRAAPTFGFSSVSHFGVYNGSSIIAVTGFSGDAPSTKVATMGAGVSSGLTTGATNQFLANNSSSARATWSAEL